MSAAARSFDGLAEAKLGLLEFLIVWDDPREVAARSVEWLLECGGARCAACFSVELEANRMVLLSARGFALEDAGAGLVIDLDDRKHPLVAAAGRREPAPLEGPFRDPRLTALLGRAPLYGLPLYGRNGRAEWTSGLLVVGPWTEETEPAATWLSRVLGHRLLTDSRPSPGAEPDKKGRRERLLLDSVPDPILLTEPEGGMLVANARAQSLLATADGDSEGRRRAVAFNNMLLSAALAQSMLQGEGRPREVLLVDPADGSDLLYELLSTAVSDPREGTAVVSILRNVTDLRRAMEEVADNYRRLRLAEADVRAERDRLDLIIDSVADPILVTDSAGALVLMNTPAERLFNVPPGSPPDYAQRVRANDAHFSSFVSNVFLSQGPRHVGGIALVDPATGTPLPVEAVSGEIFSEHGEVVTVVTVLHDRTEAMERARLYEELKRASELLEERVREATAELVSQNELLRRQRLELEQASALKSQFLANMSHEFRTPLNAILGYTSLLLEGVSGPLNDKQQRNLGRVDSNAQHLLALINDILDISRIEAGRMPLTLESIDLAVLVQEVLAELEPLIARTKLSVRGASADGLPTVKSDRAKVKQVLVNLVSNAVKFTPSGSVTVDVDVHVDGRHLQMAVTDTGIGIDAADQEKIFDDFQQADPSTERRYGGAGLGLAISRRLANMLNGRLELKSRPGEGSTFTFVLPRRS
jgi:signal transduction histidine kinase/PAS domain-containing protein